MRTGHYLAVQYRSCTVQYIWGVDIHAPLFDTYTENLTKKETTVDCTTATEGPVQEWREKGG